MRLLTLLLLASSCVSTPKPPSCEELAAAKVPYYKDAANYSPIVAACTQGISWIKDASPPRTLAVLVVTWCEPKELEVKMAPFPLKELGACMLRETEAPESATKPAFLFYGEIREAKDPK